MQVPKLLLEILAEILLMSKKKKKTRQLKNFFPLIS